MVLKNMCCTLEQGKKMKQLGVLQYSYASFFGDETMRLMDNGSSGMSYSNNVFVATTIPGNNQEEEHRSMTSKAPIASAYTDYELSIMIGTGTRLSELFFQAVKDEMNKGHSFSICLSVQFMTDFVIRLLEEKHPDASVDEINKRLAKV